MAIVQRLGPFRLDTKAELLFRDNEPVALGQRAIALLRLLIEQPGMPVSKDALIEAGWPGLAVEEANLTVQISALRRAFAEEPGGENWIETLPRRGYRYVGPITAAEDRLAIKPAPLALPDKPSIAVLPFQNLSGDLEQEYFADGVVEEIITGLARIKGLLVIARNSSFTYKGKALDVKQVGRELGARYVLEGSVRKADERVRISVVDLAGREAAVLADQAMTRGAYSIAWDARRGRSRLPSGVYFVRWKSASRTMSRKLVLMP